MDLNYFINRHQVSLMRAAAGSGPSRLAHEGLASGYATKIRALQERLGVASPMFETRTPKDAIPSAGGDLAAGAPGRPDRRNAA